MPSVDVNQLKRKAQSENEKVSVLSVFNCNQLLAIIKCKFFLQITWKWLPFTNSARKDDLQLYHWVRVVNGVPPTGDYSFAKYNKSVDVIKYTDEEYDKYLVDPAWTKEETDRLFDMCEQFDLRFIVIADRFPSSRTVEELKNRFYSVSRAILVARAPSPGDVVGHSLVKEPYNLSQEIERKRALSMVLSHSKQQERRDVEVLAEAKRISDARKAAKAAEEPELPLMADTGHDVTDKAAVAGDSVSPFPSTQLPSATIPNPVSETASVVASLRMLQVYLRSYAHEQMVQAASSSAGLRTIKRVEQTLQDLGVNLKPKVPTRAICTEHLELRKEILTLLSLQKQLQYKEAEGSSYRDGSYAETPGTPPPKRLQRAADLDRTFTPDSLSFGGERVGKRDQKRKGPGRSESPSSPAQSKRPRKYKASD
ncbi:SWR1-complex 4 [Olea europaea subsp. europaea]|uniref:SWR1-complex 4 n=1 Tax=Olea europaea subsp. europaea TaxID=158383 RepID=A0A8S0RPC2_OLEEU|nr:SWR1-complex 4 [Olea europaea subsp. europaea]